MTVADRIGVMNRRPSGAGRDAGRDLRAAEFALGRRLRRRRQSDRGRVASSAPATSDRKRAAGRLLVRTRPMRAAGAMVWVALRPEKIRDRPRRRRAPMTTTASPDAWSDIGYLGDLSIYKVRLDNGLVMKAAVVNRDAAGRARRSAPGDRVWLSLAPECRRGADAMTRRHAHATATPRRLGPAAGRFSSRRSGSPCSSSCRS